MTVSPKNEGLRHSNLRLEDYDKAQRIRMADKELVQCIALNLNKSERTIYQAIQFARLYPDLL